MNLPSLPTAEEFLSPYVEGASKDLAKAALMSFMVPMVLVQGVEYATRYALTERANKQRFTPLIAEYLAAFEAKDADRGADAACKLMDLAESIWKADA
jgi:hypothetical protein